MGMAESPKQWVKQEAIPDPMSPEERGAYQKMQAALAGSHEPDRRRQYTQNVRDDINRTDFTSAEGRRGRSRKNIAWLAEFNADCPDTLLLALTQKIIRKDCTLAFELWDINSEADKIIKGGKLLSNQALRDSGVEVSGGTAGSIVDDEKEFGNNDFLFTRPIFHDPEASVPARQRYFYIPADDKLLGEYACLGFKDWANMMQDDYLQNTQYVRDDTSRDQYLGSPAHDFFVGKSDISQAIAYKIFETLKTAMLLNPDDSAPEGFNVAGAQEFIRKLAHPVYRRSTLCNDNTLKEPLNHFSLNAAQTAFLNNPNHPLRDALIEAATEATLKSIAEHAELKVPRFMSLDGASLLRHEEGSVKLCHLTSDEGAPNARRYHLAHPKDSKALGAEDTVIHTVPPDARGLAQRGRNLRP